MKRKVIIDNRMREKEKNKLEELGYELLEINTSDKVYSEIVSHVDIFTCKVGEKIIVEPSQYMKLSKIPNVIKGKEWAVTYQDMLRLTKLSYPA